jgi:hypothetical protein
MNNKYERAPELELPLDIPVYPLERTVIRRLIDKTIKKPAQYQDNLINLDIERSKRRPK